MSADPNNWPESFRGQPVFQLNEQSPGLAAGVIRLRHLDRLVLWGLDLSEPGARAIAEHLKQLQSLRLDGNQLGQATIDVIDQPGIQGRFTNVKEVYRGNLDRPGSVTSLKQAIE